MQQELDQLNPKEYIIIKGARVHNLNNLSVAIPRNKLVVITGLSGSGKSSLAFDTLYAEGQRRYVESLSSYARQFLGRMHKPEVDYIKGISPAIAIEQRVNTRNPRSTVGTTTEIYEYIKLLFARIGKTYSPISQKLVKRHSVSDVVDHITNLPEDLQINIYFPLTLKKERTLKEQLNIWIQQGFSRILHQEKLIKITDFIELSHSKKIAKDLHILIDRVVIKHNDSELVSRIADSVQTAFYESDGYCTIQYAADQKNKFEYFSNKFELDGIIFTKPSVNFFSFNNPYGACKSCEGFGSVMGIDEDLVIPNKSLSIYEGAIACWKGEKMGEWKEHFIMNAPKFNFPVHKPYFELTEKQKALLWTGNQYFHGLNDFFKFVEEQNYKIQYRVMLARYRGKTICPECKGTRLRGDANYVKVDGKNVSEIVTTPIDSLLLFFKNIQLEDFERTVAKRLLIEITNRLQYVSDVGLGYLTLNRLSSTLSGGESQRINLATSLGSNLVGSTYILDEPSIGLHPRDTHRLINVLMHLKNLGNTVIVVEHDEEIIKAADQIIDIGPLAGSQGGNLMFQGDYDAIIKDKNSITGKYLSKQQSIPVPQKRRTSKKFIRIAGARENNLKNIHIEFPLNTLTIVSGVSGSGKTSLIKKTLYSSLKKIFGGYSEKTGKFDCIEGDIQSIGNVEMIDQNPIGRSSRSNPATYSKAYDDIRTLFAEQTLAKTRGYKPGFFSFNIEGGRCEECEGEGQVKIEMQFMADIYLECEACKGKRFKEDVLDIKYNNKNISDILDMTISEAIDFFQSAKDQSIEQKIVSKLKPIEDVGLGYIRLGQPSSTFSGGEAQRLKLAYFLTKGYSNNPTLFIFDEPTTGLHFHDIHKLLDALNALLDKGHSIIVVEHNMEIIKCADWVIDLGPEGGEQGGHIVFAGTPENIIHCKESHTAKFLIHKLK